MRAGVEGFEKYFRRDRRRCVRGPFGNSESCTSRSPAVPLADAKLPGRETPAATGGGRLRQDGASWTPQDLGTTVRNDRFGRGKIRYELDRLENLGLATSRREAHGRRTVATDRTSGNRGQPATATGLVRGNGQRLFGVAKKGTTREPSYGSAFVGFRRRGDRRGPDRRPTWPRPTPPVRRHVATWLILPVVICLSQRLSHACLSTNFNTVKLRMAH